MLELLTNPKFDEIIFLILSIGILFFSLISIIAKNTDTSIISFLFAITNLTGIVVLTSNTTVGVIIALIYASMCSLFLLIKQTFVEKKQKFNKWYVFLAISMLVIFSILVCYKLEVSHHIEIKTENYVGVSGITLVMSLIFILITSGISFLLQDDQESK